MNNGIFGMSQEDFLALDEDDATVLITTRFHVLRELGCEAEAAAVVAVHPEVGVGEAFDLIRRGCDPRTALRILL